MYVATYISRSQLDVYTHAYELDFAQISSLEEYHKADVKGHTT